ncbi:hypothetical protein [Streptomonospora nanhaiensis]|nr:hypothetical protein [Streptomonospora nanhaiensis]MBV2364254.1 hypothetical protein [Streptomonospora nanhaiensis]
MTEQYPNPVEGYDPAEDIEVFPVGDEDDGVPEVDLDPDDTHTEGVDR